MTKLKPVYLHGIRKGVHLKMWDLEIYAAVTIHDNRGRREMIQKIRALGVEPEERGDSLEIRFTGNREAVIRLATLCEAEQIHSVHVSRAEG